MLHTQVKSFLKIFLKLKIIITGNTDSFLRKQLSMTSYFLSYFNLNSLLHETENKLDR